MLEKPTLENPMQLNKDIQKTDLPTKEKINTDLQSTHSIPILSPNPSPSDREAATPPERKRKETETQSAYEIYREIIKDNISYDILMQDMKLDSEHIRFVLDCMRENTTKIRNIKQYLRAVLFNAPSTIGNYYTSLVAHDMASGALAPQEPHDPYSFKPGESL